MIGQFVFLVESCWSSASKYLVTWSLAWILASSKAVLPLMSLWANSAPWLTRYLTVSRCPSLAATCKHVRPSWSKLFRFVSIIISVRTWFRLSFWHAISNLTKDNIPVELVVLVRVRKHLFFELQFTTHTTFLLQHFLNFGIAGVVQRSRPPSIHFVHIDVLIQQKLYYLHIPFQTRFVQRSPSVVVLLV